MAAVAPPPPSREAAGQVGRPRSGPPRRAGASGRDETLDAAAELFAQRGYAATPTRLIAEAAGMRQASLYYHFPSKEQLLAELLEATVRPSVQRAAALDAAGLEPVAALHALVAYDAEVLLTARWNVGLLYALPEVATEPFRAFREEREQLRAAYRRLVTAAAPGPSAATTEVTVALVLGLVESVIAMRRDLPDLPGPAVLAEELAQSALRLLGWSPEQARDVAARSAAL